MRRIRYHKTCFTDRNVCGEPGVSLMSIVTFEDSDLFRCSLSGLLATSLLTRSKLLKRRNQGLLKWFYHSVCVCVCETERERERDCTWALHGCVPVIRLLSDSCRVCSKTDLHPSPSNSYWLPSPPSISSMSSSSSFIPVACIRPGKC